MASELKRLNMNMPGDLLEEVDAYADKMNLNRSSAVNFLVTLGLQQQKAVNSMEKMIVEMQKIRELAERQEER